MLRVTLFLLLAGIAAGISRGCVNPLVGKGGRSVERAYRLGDGPSAHKKRLGVTRWQDFNSVDFLAPDGTPIYAATNCTVCARKDCVVGRTAQEVRRDRFSLNSFTCVEDNGQEWYYTHMKAVTVKAGQKLRAGDPVGSVGAYRGKNAHLHLSIKQGQPCDILRLCAPADVRGCK